MNEKQLHILQHSLGLDQYGKGTFYRNRFVTGEGSKDFDDCTSLVELGFMKDQGAVEMFGGSHFFTVTEAGRNAVVAESPSPPKLTRGQQNYLDWLRYDCSMSFIDYLKWKSRERKERAA